MNEITTSGPGTALAKGDEPDSIFSLIKHALGDDSISADKLEKLVAVQSTIEDRVAKREFSAALHAAQSQMPKVVKHGKIDLGKGKPIAFATYEDVDAVVRPVESEHGFSRSFFIRRTETGMEVVGVLRHVGGHSEETPMPLPQDTGPGRNALQAIGSTFAYGKRYITEAMYNIVRAGEDDDGRSGGTRRISEEQKGQLVAMMAEAKDVGAPVDTAKFLEAFGIENLDGMAEKDFTRAANLIGQKIHLHKAKTGAQSSAPTTEGTAP